MLLSRRRLLAACIFLIILLVLIIALRQDNPIGELERAKTRWELSAIQNYRIVVTFERPYNTCQQDFEVRGTDIGYKHKDSCSVGSAVAGKPAMNWPTVANLFARVEDGLKNPQCGSNGCVCDGPIEMLVTYDPERGYPRQIVYTLRQDLRTRDLQYWLALLGGSLANCPPVTYVGQTISVTSLEALAPLVEQLADPTKEPLISDGEAAKPEATPE